MARKLRDYVISECIPERSVNIMAGPSGSGKTTLLFEMMKEFVAGRPVLGQFATKKMPIVYMAADRDDEDIDETLDRVKVPENLFPIYSLTDKPTINALALPDMALKDMEGGGLLIIEGIHGMVPEGKISDHSVVRDFLLRLGTCCKQRNITVIGTLHTAKTKESERFMNPRQRALGSVAWAGYTSTVFIIEPTKPESVEDKNRLLMILPRNKPQREIRMILDGDGVPRVAVDTMGPMTKALLNVELMNWFRQIAINVPRTRKELVDLARVTSNVSESTADRWLKTSLDEGKLIKDVTGAYLRPMLETKQLTS